MKGMMKLTTIVAVYTGQGLSEIVQRIFKEQLPDCRLINIIDDSIIHDVIKEGKPSKKIIQRLLKYFQIGADIGADIIINTCSSVGDVVDIARKIIDVPIVRIDEPMAKRAVEKYKHIGVLATLPTTLDPTARLIKSQAALRGKEVVITEGLAEGAYHALINGKPEEHDRLIFETARKISRDVECIVLAQGSMTRMQDRLTREIQKEILASPPLCAEYVKSLLGGLANEQG